MRFWYVLFAAPTFLANAACSDSSSSGTGGSAAGGSGGTGASTPRGTAIGSGDGTPGSVTFTAVYEPASPRSATDLAFHPTRDELWVLLRDLYAGDPCTTEVDTGCASLEGRVAIVVGAKGPSPTFKVKKDPNAWHFMRRPTGIAFGEGDTFATSAEARTGNFEDQPSDYMGPTLWSSDPAIFTIEPPGKNGSHLDMLHSTPFGMGIAHETANVYWTFNGDVGALDRYDFKQPHEVGGSDHSDGELRRFVTGEVARLPEVPSHMVFDPKSSFLYISDTGNHRVVKLDTTSGTTSSTPLPVPDPMVLHETVDGATLVDVVPAGILEAPSGLELFGDVLFVTDNATSRIHAFELDGTPIRQLDTGMESGTLAGFTIGPDGKAYFVDLQTSRVYRIDT